MRYWNCNNIKLFINKHQLTVGIPFLRSLNYGALGFILGHELTHGFDDNGRNFDVDGNYKRWWTDKTIAKYENKTGCFTEYYNEQYLKDVSCKERTKFIFCIIFLRLYVLNTKQIMLIRLTCL